MCCAVLISVSQKGFHRAEKHIEEDNQDDSEIGASSLWTKAEESGISHFRKETTKEGEMTEVYKIMYGDRLSLWQASVIRNKHKIIQSGLLKNLLKIIT